MRVVLTDCDHGFVDPERRAAAEAGIELVVEDCRTEEDVVRAAGDCEGLICQAAPITARVVAELAACRVIGRYGTGLDNIDLEAAWARGITVVHTPGFCTTEVADHALALLLALARRLPSCRLEAGSDAIQESYGERIERMRGVVPLTRATAGVIGLGRIGREVARRLACLGASVVAFDPHVDDAVASAVGARPCPLGRLLAESHFVTLHVPLTSETRGMIGAAELAAMKPGACLVNVSRGGLVEEEALLEALARGRLAGAALDVTANEPLPADHPLLALENVLVTPHVAFYSDDALADVKYRTARYVMNALRGEGEYEAAALA